MVLPLRIPLRAARLARGLRRPLEIRVTAPGGNPASPGTTPPPSASLAVGRTPLLPLPPRELDAAFGDPATGLVAEEGIAGSCSLVASALVRPELQELPRELVGQEHVSSSTALGDVGPDADARP